MSAGSFSRCLADGVFAVYASLIDNVVSDQGGDPGTRRTTASGNRDTGPAFWELGVDPVNHDIVLAAATNGLLRSEDGGKDWVVTGEAGLPGPAELRGGAEIAVAPSDLLRVYVHYTEMSKAGTSDTPRERRRGTREIAHSPLAVASVSSGAG